MKIYVASSWRNTYQPTVVNALRRAGHEVYDFRTPEWNGRGFSWSEVCENEQALTFTEYLNVLGHPISVKGFKSDMDALEWCDACILVLPCGRSAHLELGWSVGVGKTTAILHDSKIEPELMSKMVDAQFNGMGPLIDWLGDGNRYV